LNEDADFRAVYITHSGNKTYFDALRPGNKKPLAITLNMPGKHNVLNALAAIAVSEDEEISDEAMV